MARSSRCKHMVDGVQAMMLLLGLNDVYGRVLAKISTCFLLFQSQIFLQGFLDLEAALGQERERRLKMSTSYDSSTHGRLWVHGRMWSMSSSSPSR